MRKIFTPILTHNGTLSENVVMQIEALIESDSLKIGDKLPPERELAEIFGVSRTCIREAVKSLAARNMLSIEHGRGVFVKEKNAISEEDIAKILKKILWTDPKDMKCLFEIRKLIEPQGVIWAVQRGSNDEIKEICTHVKVLEKMGDKDINLIKLWDADIKFHMAIVRASHNQVLARVMQNMLDLMAESRRNTLKYIQRSLKSVDEHILICDAIIERDADLAAQRMIQHLENVYKDLFNL